VSAEILALGQGHLALELCPHLGGSIANFRWRRAGSWIDLLRPTSRESIAKADIEAVACFPLTPFSNRLRKGRFHFRDRDIVMPLNTSGPHVEHGHGWQRPWQVAMSATDRAILRLTHVADAWPFPYVMELRFQLSDAGLDIELVTRNTGDGPMPYGFGLHPYFPSTPRCTLTASVSGFWETDEEVMPTRLTQPPAELDPARGLPVAKRSMDNAFTGWRGRAVIDWPEHQARLTMTATPALGVLVVYVPPGEGYFCAEPVSNTTDAMNMVHARDDTGLVVLAPGASISARVTFRVEALG
jgi:aldose 1-epimerase